MKETFIKQVSKTGEGDFYIEDIKIGDEIDTKQFAQKLLNIGYKRSTMVSDVQEFRRYELRVQFPVFRLV